MALNDTLAVSATAQFDHWVTSAPELQANSLSPKTIAVYRCIWRRFTGFLGEKPWQKACADDVKEFMTNGIRSLARQQKQPSQVAVKRYWRVLHNIYAFAELHQRIQGNPFSESPERFLSESADALVLPPRLINQLIDGLYSDFRSARLDSSKWQYSRDVALVAIILLTAAKAEETTSLRTSDIRIGGFKKESRTTLIHMAASGGLTERTFELPDTTWNAKLWPMVEHWLETRKTIDGKPIWLFFGQKHSYTVSAGPLLEEASVKQRCPLTEKSVFIITSQAISRHISIDLAHRGPQALRNSVIANWLIQGMDEATVMRMSGINDIRALRRLDIRERKTQQKKLEPAANIV